MVEISRICVVFSLFIVGSTLVFAGSGHPVGHPVADLPIHEKFYSTWYKPDKPAESCCNKQDCYPTVIKYEGEQLFAKRREDGEWLPVPPEKIEKKRDNPDGRNHVCAPPPNHSQAGQVFCFTLGTGG